MNVTAMARSLGYYVYLKQQANVAQADFEHVDDYHDFLGDVVAEAQAGAKYAGFNATNPLIPLEEITLTQIQYGDIVNQIFSGVNFMVLSLPHPAPQVPVVQNSVSYFDNYIQSLDGGKGDPRTKADVESIIERMNKLLSEREANEQRVNGLSAPVLVRREVQPIHADRLAREEALRRAAGGVRAAGTRYLPVVRQRDGDPIAARFSETPRKTPRRGSCRAASRGLSPPRSSSPSS